MAKSSVTVKFTPVQVERGEWGEEFYTSTFRFPLKAAQKFERRAVSRDLTMASLLSQLVMAFNDCTEEPKGVQVTRTKDPTIWGAKEKKAYFKSKGREVPVKRVDKPEGKKAKKVVKASKKVKAEKKSAEKAPKKAKKSAVLLARLKALKEDAA